MSIRYIDPDDLTRKDLFHFYGKLDYPQFNVCAQVDLARAHEYARSKGLSVFTTILYLTSRAANSIPELRYRIRGNRVVEHDFVHPSFTVLTREKVFGFCEVKYSDDVAGFYDEAEENIKTARQVPDLKDEHGRDDYLYVSSLPWVRFTSISHPIHMSPADTIPRISWGKHEKDNGKLLLPLSIQVHHALADGFHVGRFFQLVQEYMDNPGEALAPL